METSPKIDELAKALSLAQAKIEGAKESSTNPFFHSKYADLAEVWDACRKPLTDNGLSFVQSISSEEKTFLIQVPTKEKDTGRITGEKDVVSLWLVVTSRLLHSSGQWIEDIISMPVEADPQAIGKVTTYIRRYALMALCGIAPEDDDGESAAGHKPTSIHKPENPVDQTEHYCQDHKVKFFKTEKMKSYAHGPAEEGGKWCYEKNDTPTSSPDTQQQPKEGTEKAEKEPKTLAELFSMAFKDLGIPSEEVLVKLGKEKNEDIIVAEIPKHWRYLKSFKPAKVEKK